jgi:hypothetical protein
MQTRLDRYGYVQIKLTRDGKPFRTCVHRLVLLAFVGPPPEGTQAMHADDNPQNNRLDNLSWGTWSENQAQRVRNGRLPRGEDFSSSKLTAEKVRQIRARWAAENGRRGLQAALGHEFGVTPQNISSVVKRRTWNHID